jgi:hypothetical protein
MKILLEKQKANRNEAAKIRMQLKATKPSGNIQK